MNKRWTFFIAPIFLTIVLACVVPGLSTSSTSTPMPTLTVDAGAIETMVAGTVSAAIAQTEQSMPGLATASVIIITATPTPTSASTATSISTPTSTFTFTSTPTSTSTLTATSTSEVLGPSKSVLYRREDGSVLFSDRLAQYEVKLPGGWLAARINEKEYRDALLLEEAANTHIQQALLGVQNEDPNSLRLYAIDTSHIQNEFVSDMRFVFDATKRIPLNSDVELQAIAAKIPETATVFRFEVTSVKIVKSARGMDLGMIETKSSFTSALGVDVPIYQKRVFFNVPAGTQSITFTTVADLKEMLLPAFDAMLETINPIEK
ncbi:hypothetical protein ANAEL_02626 [Anaerolineales bacterium]|nr:hypothetical protein ANAEL_02626 [Anaerolineales bacterium]